MNIAKCEQCGEIRELTHHVKSSELDLEVCYSCGVFADVLRSDAGDREGEMTVELVERPRVIPMFFECSFCGKRFTGEHAYQAHWHEWHG